MDNFVKFIVTMIVTVTTGFVGVKIIFMIFNIYDMNIGFVPSPFISADKDPIFFQYSLIFFGGIIVLYVMRLYEITKTFQRNVNEKLYEILTVIKQKR